MLTLAAISCDSLAYLLEYLTGDEIHSLLCSGDRLLRSKVAQSLRRLELRPRHNEDFPFTALRLPQLQSFSVICYGKCYLRLKDDENFGSTSLEGRKSRLTSLHLEFTNLAALFTQEASISMYERFPLLTELVLRCSPSSQLVDALSWLPQTLTKLAVDTRRGQISLRSLSHGPDINSIANLPKSLLSLDLSWYAIYAQNDQVNLASLLPPRLTALKILSFKKYTVVTHLPPNLVSLGLDMQANGTFWQTSLLPKNLTELRTNQPLNFDCPLPQSLVTLNVPNDTYEILLTLDNGNPNWKGLPLPPGLEYCYIDCLEAPNDYYRRIKRILAVGINKDGQIEEVSRNQHEGFPKKMDCNVQNIRFFKPLPPSIDTVNIMLSMAGEDIQMLPKSLKVLDFNVWDADEDFVPFPPWSLEHVAQLPKYLQELKISFNFIDDGRKLAPISGIALDKLFLTEVPTSQLETAPDWLPSCLPRHLKSLDLIVKLLDQGGVSTECIRLCNLAEAVPHLERLMMEVRFTDAHIMTPLLSSLPPKLDFLSLLSLRAVFEHGAFSSLPKSLARIIIGFAEESEDESNGCMSNDHLQGLPERLSELSITLSSNHTIDGKVVKYFPKTLVEVRIISGAMHQGELNRDIAEHIAITCCCPEYKAS